MTKLNNEEISSLIRNLDLAEQVHLLESLARLVRHQFESSRQHSILELEGLGADIWKGKDAQEYVQQERESWPRDGG